MTQPQSGSTFMLWGLLFAGSLMHGESVASGFVRYEFNSNGTYNAYEGAKLLYASAPCPKFPVLGNETQTQLFYECLDATFDEMGPGAFILVPPPAPLVSHAPAYGRTPEAAGTVAPSLGSTTPLLPFIGNQLVFTSYVPNAAFLYEVTAAYAVGLRRQADCSLSEDFVLPGTATPNAGVIATLPSAELYIHKLAGLTTTAGVFPQGCAYPLFGQPSNTWQLLQPTPDGGSIVASLSSNLLVNVDDPVANTLRSTILLSGNTNPSLGAFSAAQLTASGNMDIVATFATDPASHQLATAVLLGNGDGTFKPVTYYDIAGDVTIDDVNGDGIPDIVICTPASGIVALIGKGDGTFSAGTPTATSLSCGGAAGEILTGDFNGDGKKDLLVLGTVFLGHGDGTFTVGSPVSATAAFNLSSSIPAVAVGDVNRDGKADVVISQTGYVAVFLGNGDGTFVAGRRYAALPDYMQVSITDVDGDGNPDIVLGAGSAGIYLAGCCGDNQQPPLFQVLMGHGDGTFVDSLAYEQGHYGSPVLGVAGPQIAIADFNLDGQRDVLVFVASNNGGQPGTLQLLPGNGSGTLGAPITSPVNISPTMLVSADMNQDGKPDVVIAGSALAGPQLAVLLNQGNGSFGVERDYALPDTPVSLAVGDFNGDGRIDVAVGVAASGSGGAAPSGVYVLLAQANGTLSAPIKVDSSLYPTGLAVGEINGDGRADLVVADQGFFSYAGSSSQVNGAVHVYLGNAAGTFDTAASPTTPATNYSVVALGDLNGDGNPDLILGGNVAGAQDTSTPSVYTLLGNGNGTFQAPSAAPLFGNYGIGSTSIAIADFNHDGHLDVAVGDATAFTSVLLGSGDGTLIPTILTLGQLPGALAAADMNGDGLPELFVGSTDIFGGASLDLFINTNRWPTVATVPAYSAGTVAIPEVRVGNAIYLNMAITVGRIVSGPAGATPASSGYVYDPSTRQLTVPAVTVGATAYHNAVVTVAGLLSVAGVTGADFYDGRYLTIPSVQVLGGPAYHNVVITPGKILGVAGGMPQAVQDQYNASTRQLLIPAVEYGGTVYTNATITVGTIVSVNGAPP